MEAGALPQGSPGGVFTNATLSTWGTHQKAGTDTEGLYRECVSDTISCISTPLNTDGKNEIKCEEIAEGDVMTSVTQDFSNCSLAKDAPTDDSNKLATTNQKPATYTMKKKKLEHFINNLFKAANEKVTQPEESENQVRCSDLKVDVLRVDESTTKTIQTELSPIKCHEQQNIKIKEEDIKPNLYKTTINGNDDTLAANLVSVKIKEDPEGVVLTPEAVLNTETSSLKIKSEKPTENSNQVDEGKPTEKMFGWCNIEDLNNPLAVNVVQSSIKFEQEDTLDISYEQFEIKQEPPPTPAYEMNDDNDDYRMNLFGSSEVKQEFFEEHEMKLEFEASSSDQNMFMQPLFIS